MPALSLDHAREMDARDGLRQFRQRFVLPPDVVYLDGNSLGALPHASVQRLSRVVEREWGNGLIRSWSEQDWLHSPSRVGTKIAQLIGAYPDEVIVTDTTSVNLFRLVLCALEMRAGRREVLTDSDNFPTDSYICEGVIRATEGRHRLRSVPRAEVAGAVGDDTAVVVLTHVHYRTGERYDMRAVTAAIQARGALVVWDLSHSAGAVNVDLTESAVDFAAGCGYKYLNGGPGAPSFLYAARRHHALACNAISGWFGHSRPFEFEQRYAPAAGVRRFLSGTPSIIGNCLLESGVDLMLEAGMDRIVEKSQRLCDFFIELVEQQCAGLGLTLITPRAVALRGSHVSYAHPRGAVLMKALIEASVIGDFRPPDVLRFGFTPLYVSFEDVWTAVHVLRGLLAAERVR